MLYLNNNFKNQMIFNLLTTKIYTIHNYDSKFKNKVINQKTWFSLNKFGKMWSIYYKIFKIYIVAAEMSPAALKIELDV